MNLLRSLSLSTLTAVTLAGCANPPAAPRVPDSPGADALFQQFVKCDDAVFRHITQNAEALKTYGEIEAHSSGGNWFATKSPDNGPSSRTAVFKTPMTINGLTVTGVLLSHFPSYGKDDRPDDYWGFYLSNDPRTVLTAMRARYRVFMLDFPGVGIMPVDLRYVTESPDKYYSVGLSAETTNDIPGARTLLTCSIQRKFGSLKK
ncbi:hypothetical protein [Viridibacterium curvum]|uniref:Lipoprotein n=1 Tax=Viridibacterium curvum TaxID=1101404 RepID=A0ABP9QLU4_9RHOO